MKYNPTVKERRFLKAYLEGKPLAECAKYAGSRAKDTHSLSQVGYRWLKKVDLSMQEILDLCGLSDEVLARKLQEALEADRLYLASYEGKFLDERKAPDIPTRLKAVELVGRMRGHFIDRHELTGKDGGDIVLQVRPASAKREPRKIQIDEIED
jgi:hypothetical protein